mmetsp:Transcript_10544/g.38793  ORF Transcript_10544/g.38793 Transcript_10544/m.38793 type:complete len:211 (-) Transcript_10544:1400-2032(-)
MESGVEGRRAMEGARARRADLPVRDRLGLGCGPGVEGKTSRPAATGGEAGAHKGRAETARERLLDAAARRGAGRANGGAHRRRRCACGASGLRAPKDAEGRSGARRPEANRRARVGLSAATRGPPAASAGSRGPSSPADGDARRCSRARGPRGILARVDTLCFPRQYKPAQTFRRSWHGHQRRGALVQVQSTSSTLERAEGRPLCHADAA